MDRREFLLSTCKACAAMVLVPAAALEGCAPSGKALAVKDGVIEVPMDALGSNGTAIVKAKGIGNKLMLVKRADGSFTALELNCPHKNGPLKQQGGHLVCQWHGSRFDLEGKVQNGPAKQDLKRYTTELSGDKLRILLT